MSWAGRTLRNEHDDTAALTCSTSGIASAIVQGKLESPTMTKDEPGLAAPTLSELSARLDSLEHHSSTILLLSSINLFANVLTIVVAFLAAL